MRVVNTEDFESIATKVDNTFPGLLRLLESGIRGIYQHLHMRISEGDLAEIEEQLPDLWKYLGDDNPNPDEMSGSPSQAYQALAALLTLAATLEGDIEADDDM